MKMNKKIVWVAVLTSFALFLSVGSAYSRLNDWASAELIYMPVNGSVYSSDCLIQGGQQILLADWQPGEMERTVTIAISRPAVETTDATEITTVPQETAAPETTEGTIPETTEVTVPETTEISTAATIQEETEAATDAAVMTVGETIPEETEETTEATEESTDVTEETTEATEENITDATEENTVTTEETWPLAEVAATMNETANTYFTCEVQEYESKIQVVLKLKEDAPALDEAVQAEVHLEWQGLEGTLCINIRPSEVAAILEDEESQTDRAMEGLELVQVMGTIDPEKTVACVKLNLETQEDFLLTFMKGNEAINRVRWSLDGESYSVLYDSSQLKITWPYADGWNGVLFLDFSCALEENQQPSIIVAATKYEPQTFTPVLEEIPQVSQLVVKTVDLPYTIETSTLWGDAFLEPQGIERLTTDEEGALVYAEDTALTAAVTEAGILLTPTQENVIPVSGSYRMTVKWIWNETAVYEQIIYFFINTN